MDVFRTFTDPFDLPIIRPNNQHQIIPRGIVGMQEVRHEAEQPEAAGKDDELILCTQLGEEVLLVFLDMTSSVKTPFDTIAQQGTRTRGKDSFTGGLECSSGMRSGGRVRAQSGARRLEERRVVTWS